MNWAELLFPLRTGQSLDKVNHKRTEFQRDYDRLVFSAPFRRMQNKTQVFPLPGAIFVHNRLTHSLEVSSVGRSLGNIISERIAASHEAEDTPYITEIGSIVASGCLAHDMGNPPFGHSGESAISHYFSNGRGQEYLSKLTDLQQADLVNFDGNANTFRLLTHSFAGRRDGGYALTYPTVASIIKYPRSAEDKKKFGYFQQDKPMFDSIMKQLGIPVISTDKQQPEYARHPLVYLVEAADDICYQVMDVEDSYRLGILDYDQTRELLMGFFDPQTESERFERFSDVCQQVTDKHEQVAYMRSIVIGKLVKLCADTFWNNRQSILDGRFEKSLIDHLPPFELQAMKVVKKLSFEKIYRHQSVVEIELSGFKIIGTLLDEFINAINHPDRYYSRLLTPFVAEQFRVPDDAPLYDKLISIVDLVSGMTDLYALDLFKKIKGIGLG